VAKVLVLLHARACQTSFEVHALLAAGFPGGAYGRYRTLHELAVIAILIAEHGREHGHTDLADRYLSHSHIEQYKHAQHSQRSGRQLGWPPIPASTMKELKKEHDRLIARYGHDYRDDYGWATRLTGRPGQRVSFTDLEARADMTYLRDLYATGSHLIHASAHGLGLTVPNLSSGEPLRLTGPSDTHLAQPAQASLNALLLVTGRLMAHGPAADDANLLLNFLGLHELRNRTITLFDEAADQAGDLPLPPAP
jgi:Family of unknown function (DUF5677)